ncbi:regulatory protein GemA [Minwuia thermotolerans]|nr:regulatory protein GemA [Minwuia thermotolerans]
MTVPANRKALLAKSAIAVKQLGIEEADFRDLLEARYGARSRTKLSDDQLVDLVEHFRSQGFRPAKKARARRPSATPGARASSGMLSKIRALWISGWHLGVVRDRSDEALSAWARNVTRVERAEWQHGEDAMKVVEGLKDFLSREAGVAWNEWGFAGRPPEGLRPAMRDRLAVLAAQGRKLHELGRFETGDAFYVAAAIGRTARPKDHYPPRLDELSAEELDRVIAAFGRRIRRAEGIPEDRAGHG